MGFDATAIKCLQRLTVNWHLAWAGAVCRALSLTVLIVDSQTKGNGRFVAVGPPAADVSVSDGHAYMNRQ